MRWLIRASGICLLGLALILLVIDGTRILAADDFVFSTLGELWRQISPDGPPHLETFIVSHTHALLWDPVITSLLTWPGWAVLGVAGVILVILGRAPGGRRFVRDDQL